METIWSSLYGALNAARGKKFQNTKVLADMRDEYVFPPKRRIFIPSMVLIVAAFVAAWMQIELGVSDAMSFGVVFVASTVIVSCYFYFLRFQPRKLAVYHGELEIELAGPPPRKAKRFRISDLEVSERKPGVLVIKSHGRTVATLRRSSTTEYLWNKIRSRLGVGEDGVVWMPSEDVMVASYEFAPVRVRQLMMNGLIGCALIAVSIGLILHLDLFRMLRIVVSLYLPLVLLAYFICRDELVKLVISTSEVILEPLGMAAPIPGTPRKFPKTAIHGEIYSDRLVLKEGAVTVGIVRRNSTTKAQWEKLLNDIAEHVHAVPTA